MFQKTQPENCPGWASATLAPADEPMTGGLDAHDRGIPFSVAIRFDTKQELDCLRRVLVWGWQEAASAGGAAAVADVDLRRNLLLEEYFRRGAGARARRRRDLQAAVDAWYERLAASQAAPATGAEADR